MKKKLLFAALVIVVLLGGWWWLKPEPKSEEIIGTGEFTRQVPGWSGRPYDLHIPPSYNPSKATPVVLMLHGGGGNSSNRSLTCPQGDLNSPKCLDALADREGFIVVYPNGTKSLIGNARTWNSGGGTNGYFCAAGKACADNVDDYAYFKALFADLESVMNVDKKRVFSTGISNGASMSYRLACQLSDKIAAIAPVASGDQFSTTRAAECKPTHPLSIIEFHGTEDQGHPIEGGSGGVSAYTGEPHEGIMSSINGTLENWAKKNGCSLVPTKEQLPDRVDDGTSVTKERYSGCTGGAEVVFYRIEGGGHTWPQGKQYMSEARIGRTSQEINANELIWEFFKKHPMP